ncbi:MAG: hypothetical protein A2V70_02160 [Planctomycetes bacterium RBG_13_63_9]|nr:MAG: hypothetical protein A2V70_02160 [Planctomycetes bacterium RBG_13_63_9]
MDPLCRFCCRFTNTAPQHRPPTQGEFVSAVVLVLLLALPQAAPDTVVVCPDEFREVLQPWLAHRSRQGHVVALVSNADSADAIRRRIRDAAKGGRLRFVVLIGDADPTLSRDASVRARCVPAHYAKAEVNVLWGSEPHIATDNWYADLDDDEIPELAIGRITADTAEELGKIVQKILAYERSNDFGPWRRRLNFVAGVGGFGPLADQILESAAQYVLTGRIPPEFRVSMTYGNWRSPYCPDPRLFHATTLQRFNEGSWFWVYIGHGFHLGLDRVQVPGGDYHILAAADVPKLKCEHAAPVALFLACYTGAYDATADCLAERMLLQDQGPVAVLAGSRVTMPYAMTLLATGLMDQCFEHRAATLGEAFLRTKQNMVKEPTEGDQQRAMIDAIAAGISPAPKKLAVERAEHLLLFNLFGDPLLRLRYPKPVELEVPATATAGEPLEVRGVSPVAGRATIELVVHRARLTFKPPDRAEYPQTSGALAELQETYQRANDRCLTSVELPVENGPFAARLEIPEAANGACHVRVFVDGADDFASGAADVKIDTPLTRR